jgi:general secretion pathway protein K
VNRVPERERGAALLAVLVVVAVTGALAAAGMEKLRLSAALAANGAALDQARGYALGLEQLLALTVEDVQAKSPGRTTLAGGWNGRSRSFPLPNGAIATAQVRDGGNCFNLNGLVSGDPVTGLRAEPAGIARFARLMTLIGIPEPEAARIADSAADWADTDGTPRPLGAEDPDYAAAERPYRAANTWFAEPSELRAVAGVTPESYARLRPWICALPAAGPGTINVNTLAPAEAPLLAMLDARLGLEEARRAIAARPQAGWSNVEDFARAARLQLPQPALAQLGVRTDWFAFDLRVELDGAELEQGTLIDARFRPVRVAARHWGEAQ